MDYGQLLRWFATMYAGPFLTTPVPGSPPALAQLYALPGELTRGQDRLLTPAELYTEDGVLVFRHENQQATRWGVSQETLDEPDPPVLYERDGNWLPYLPSVSAAATETAMSEWLLAGSEDTADNRPLDPETLTTVQRTCRAVPLPEYPMWMDPDGPPTRWYSSEGVLLRADGETWLWVRATTAAGLAEVRRMLPGDWTSGM